MYSVLIICCCNSAHSQYSGLRSGTVIWKILVARSDLKVLSRIFFFLNISSHEYHFKHVQDLMAVNFAILNCSSHCPS